MRQMYFVLMFVLCASAIEAQPLNRIDPNLAKTLERIGDDGLAQVIIVLSDQVDVNGMRQAFGTARASKDVRHYQVVTALQEKATATQRSILQYLADQRGAGTVEHYEPIWIVNMVFATATKKTILDLATRDDVGMIFEDGLLELDAPVEYGPASDQPGAAEPNLRAINAHKLWELGYSGQGTTDRCDIERHV